MPSTRSSNTSSAWLIAVCGRDSGELSILTTTAGYADRAGSPSSSPVSGYRATGATVEGAAVVGATVVGGSAAAIALVLPPQPAASSAMVARPPARVIIGTGRSDRRTALPLGLR